MAKSCDDLKPFMRYDTCPGKCICATCKFNEKQICKHPDTTKWGGYMTCHECATEKKLWPVTDCEQKENGEEQS